ncbi:hypothetical protein HYV43_01825 [Candidatus Micrarchaeota archaeon]|nr:hypothetical protein [Candidatus Micrarchaeota archaeon]
MGKNDIVLIGAGLVLLALLLTPKKEAPQPSKPSKDELVENPNLAAMPPATSPTRSPAVLPPTPSPLANAAEAAATLPAPLAGSIFAALPGTGLLAGAWDAATGYLRDESNKQPPAETSGTVSIVTGTDSGSQTAAARVKSALKSVGISAESMSASEFARMVTISRGLGVPGRKVNYLVLGGWLTPGFESGLGEMLLKAAPIARDGIKTEGDIFVRHVELGAGVPVIWAFGWTAKDTLNAGLDAVTRFFGEVGTAEPIGTTQERMYSIMPIIPKIAAPVAVVAAGPTENQATTTLLGTGQTVTAFQTAPTTQLRLLDGSFALGAFPRTPVAIAFDQVRRLKSGESGVVDTSLLNQLNRQEDYLKTLPSGMGGADLINHLATAGIGFDTGVLRAGLKAVGLI